ncbi:MAG: hypothetical protein P8045_15685 [Candidatus Thiodiazotropha sp.]|jgi:hypothetical protein
MPKTPALRLALIALEQRVSIDHLIIDCSSDSHHQALSLRHAEIGGLTAYLYTYAQSEKRYGLELYYPTQLPGEASPYGPMEELPLEQVIDQLCMHFELT